MGYLNLALRANITQGQHAFHFSLSSKSTVIKNDMFVHKLPRTCTACEVKNNNVKKIIVKKKLSKHYNL
jgi:hypothetical protein